MKVILSPVALIAAAISPTLAFARDPAPIDAHARDHETVRQLNRDELAKVQQRDASEVRRSRHADQAMADYARKRAQYERDMAQWHRAAARCGDANREFCER